MKNRPLRVKGSRPLLEALEDQVLYSADALGGLDSVLVATHDDTVLEASLLPASDAAVEARAQQGAVSAEHQQAARHEVVFVDTDTPDYQQFVDDLTSQSNEDRQLDIFVLDNSRDGIAQISEVLAGYDNLDAVHIISHGTDGSIDLGGSRLDVDVLNASAADIGTWANAFAESGDFLIYGCNLAASADGQSFVDGLASLTGADVAASDDLTGSASLGGDWNLEYSSGSIETSVAISASAQSGYEAVLANTATFQQGVNGYTGTQDTFTEENSPNTDQGSQLEIEVDLNDGAGDGTTQGLIRFDDLFGTGPGQIPFGATIDSASLTINVTNLSDPGAQIALHQMLMSWNESSTWTTTGSGVQTNDAEAAAAFDSVLANPDTLGAQTFLGLASTLQAWSDGGANDGWVIVTDNDNGWDFSSSEDGTVSSRPVLTVTYTAPAGSANLWMTTEEDVASPSGANGLDSWTGGSVLSFNDPNLAYDPGGTDGTLSNALNLDSFVQDGDSRLDAVHYVGTNMTVGTNAISLQAGDILLSSVFNETLVNSDASTLSVTSRDVFIFRADSLTDYALGGTFIKLIDGADLSVEIEGITLVEQTTTVGSGGGATTLNPGDFLFTDRDNVRDIYRLQPGVLGDAATNTGTISLLVDGSDIGIGQSIHGVELVEADVVVGDRTLTSGQLLVSLYADDVVAGTSVSRSDIFILNVTDTGSTTTATAEAFFTGGDIGFDTWQESPWAVSLVPTGIPALNISVEENTTAVTTVTPTDPGLDTPTFAITGGADQGLFSIDLNSGFLTFDAAPDFEAPGDVGANNIYEVEVTAADAYGGTEVQAIQVTVTNADDAGVNDAPENAVPAAQTINQGGMLLFSSMTGTGISVSDFDAGGSPIQITLAVTNGMLNLSGTQGLSFSTGDGTADTDMVFTGTVGDINAALEGATFAATPGFIGSAGVQIITNDQGNTGTGGALSDTDSIAITVQPPDHQLWLTFENDEGGTGNSDIPNITGGDVVTFGDITQLETSNTNPLASTTSGTLAYGFNLDTVLLSDGMTSASDGNTIVNAVHYVTQDIQVGSNAIQLQAGDILLSTDADETIDGTTYKKDDVLVFRPDTLGDYSQGSFFLLIDGNAASLGLNNITAISLVEQSTTVGGVTLNAGEFLFAHDGSGKNILRYPPGTLGGTTTGTATVFISGAEIDFGQNIGGLHLVQSDTVIGGVSVTAGELLVSLRDNDSKVGDAPTIDVRRQDIFVLDVSATGTGSTAATATRFFEGLDENLDGNNESIWGIGYQGNAAPTIDADTFAVDENSANATVVGSVTAADPELGTLHYAITAGNTDGAFAIDATTGQISVANTAALDFETTPVFNLTVAAIDPEGAYGAATITVNLNNVDESAIVTGDISFSGNEGDAVSGDMDATDDEGLTDGTVFSVTSPATNGTAAIDPATGAWSFTPTDPNWFGSDSFEVTVTDDLGGTTTQVVNITLANVDDPSTITGDISFSGDEGDVVSGDMDATDVEGLTDGTVFSVTSPATNGTAAIDPATGAWSFTPTDTNWFGTDAFTVTVTDDLGGTTTQVVNITLANVDDSATITGDISFSGDEGDVVSGDMDAADVEGLTDGTVFSVTSPATNGTAVIDPATGAWSFTPTDSNWFGSDTFTVTVTDDLGGTTTQVVSITLANVDDSATITGDISFSGDEGDVVAGDLNATDIEGLTDGTVFSVTSPATNGTAVIDPATGAWSFTPTDSNWFGSDTFTVTVTDDLGGTTTQVVSITLANVDDAAVITGDVSFSGDEGDVVSGDMDATDVEGLTDGTVFSVTSPATNGTAVIDPATGAWSFTPTDANWFGSDTFTVTVTDDLGGTTTQVVNITLANVDDPATITGDISFSGDEGDVVAGDLNATDIEGLTDGTIFSVTSPATNGTAVIDPATGAWSFTPTDTNWFGTDAFTVTVTDDLGGTTTQVVNITLANVDDPATITGDISFSGDEGDVVAGDMDATDIEGLTDGTVFSVTSPATNGTAAIDPATGAWSFTPTDSNWFGTDSFTVTVTDDLGGTTTQVVNITLANVDDSATITGDISFSGDEGDAVSGDMDATDIEGLTDGTVFSVTSPATNGTAAIDPATGAWSFTPTDSNWFGTDAFTVTVTDDLGGTTTQVVNITLANVDDAAVITGDISFSGDEGDVVAGDLNATDVEGLTDGTVFSVTSPATNGTAAIDPATGAWSFTPTDSNWFGTDAFTVTVTDDLGGTTTQVVNITLANVDDSATITGDISFSGDEGDVVAGDLNATDVEGLTDGTVFSVTSPATNGTAVIDPATGAWSFTPTDANWFGSDTFTVTVTDDLGGTTTQVVSITLANVDDAAVITGDVSFSGDEGDVVAGDLNATDIEGLTDGTVFSVTSPATNGTAAIDPATGAWSFTPTDSNWFGSDTFTVTVTDDLGGTTTQVVSITLANVDDAAVITGDVSFSGDEGDVVAGDLNATDIEGLTDGTVFSVTSPATNGTAAIDPATGAWSFTPTDSSWFGTDAFTVTVTDDLGGTTTQVVNITLANVDDAAVITGDISFSGDEGDVVSGDMDATDVEGLTDGTVFSVTSPATNGTAAIDPATGAWSFTPTDSNWFGSDTFTVTVTDDLGGTTTQVVNITLANVDDSATITGDISFSGDEGDVVAGDLNATDIEGLTDGTVFSVTSPATNGTAAIDPATGAWSFTPTDSNWFGTDAFTVTVTDDLGGTTTQVVSITLANVDDSATITGDISFSGDEGDVVSGDMDATDVEGLTDGTVFSVTSPATNGTAVIDPATGAWSFTPTDSNWFGSDTFTVTVTDDLGGTTTQVVSITLANVDDSATITGDISFSGDEGDVVAGDMDATDIEGLTDGTVFSVTSPATNGTAAIDPATGAWSFTPTDSNWFGTDSFTVTVTDDLGGTTTQVVNITLANVDDSATITGDISFSGDEGDAVSGDMDATDIEGLTDGTVFSVTSPATNGTAAIDPATGAWSFTPTDSNWFGTDAFTVTVTDDLGGTTTQVVNITLANVDDAAVITGDISFSGDEGDVVAGDLNATDVEGLTDGTVFSVTSPATNGTAAIDPATGAWSFTPTDSNWFGTDAFTVTVTDDLGGTTTQVVNITLANVDDSATITGDISFSGDEGDVVAGDLNATDVEGLTDGTVFSVTSPATNGTAVIDPATGAWSFTPTDANWFGSDTFTVTVTDDLGGTTTQVVSITLANVDDAAVITGDVSFSGDEGDVVAGDLNATDIEGLTDGTVFSVTSPATNGTAAIDPATGAWSFTPTDSNWFGSDTFTVTVTDDLGGTTTQVVSITLANVDDAAVITGDVSFSGDEGDVVAGDLNATDIEGLTDGTVFSVTSPATNGTAAIDPATGAWSFTPTDSSWFGTDAFTVTVTDDLGGTTTQVVSITLANVDDSATITGDIGFSGDEGDVVSGDMDATDVEGLTDGTVFSVTSPATNGTAVIDPATGAWSFTPTDSNWFGSDTFTVTVTDDLGGTTTQVVSITLANVDDAAVITGDISFSGDEGDVVSGDMDATDIEGLTDGTVFSVTSPATNGTAVIDPATGAWSFTPTDSNWFGSDTFTVTVTDDLGGTTTQVVSITLANVDDAAVITGDISFSGDEGDVVSGDMDATDVEGLTDGTVFSVTSPATNGTAAIDPATGAWSFTPTDSNWFGSDTFTVTVTDDLGGTTTQVVNITLANVDDSATITGDISFSGDEGDVVGGDMDATDVEGLTDGTVFSVTSPATNGTAAIDPATGAWSFTPTDSNWFGSDTFTVTVTDDLGGTTAQVVNITLANVDDAAVITGDISFSGNEGDVISGDMDATDVEGLTDGTIFSVTSPATNGTAAIDPATGVWSFTPTDANWFGSDSFTVTVTDDLGGTTTQVVSITLANVDDAAVITGDISYSGNEGDVISGDMDATDVEGLTDGTVFTVSAPAANGTAAIDPATGAWSFTPAQSNWFGSDSFTVTVTDDLGGTTTQVINITLANVDDAAVITGDISFSGNEGDVISGDMDATDVEGLTDGTVFTVSAPAANGTAAIDPATGVWSFTPPDTNWFGSDSFTVTVTDDLGGTTTQVVSITLANVDDPAVITGDISFSGNEGDVISGDMDATDVEGLNDGRVFTVSAPAANGTAAIDPATGVWSFTPPDTNWFGSDSFTVTVTDDLGGTTTQVVSITLANVDDAAVITGDISYSGNEGDVVSGDMDATDVEGLTDGTVFSVTSPATNGTAAIDPATGAWSFTPTDSNWFGSDAFTVTVTDDLGGTSTQVINISLTAVDDLALVGGVDTGSITEDFDVLDGRLRTAGTLTVTDPDHGESAFQADVISGAYGVFSNDTAGNWRYVANNETAAIQTLDVGNTLVDTFTVTTTGGTTHDIVITINGAADAAVISGNQSGTITKDHAVATQGSLSIFDIDAAENPLNFNDTPATLGDNGHGYFELSAGIWTYTLNTASAAVQLLDVGETLQDTFEFTASDGSTKMVTITIQGASSGKSFIEVVGTEGSDDDSPDAYEWLGDVVAVASTAADNEEESSTIDENTPLLDEISSTDAIVTMTPGEPFASPLLAEALESVADRQVRVVPPPTHRDEARIRDFIADTEPVVQPVIEANTEFEEYDEFAIASEIPLNEQQANRNTLRIATQAMRDEMREAVEDEHFKERIADIGLRVSGTAISTGSLAWLLRGASLFASALSSVPTWKGFDPLPVLTRSKRSKDKQEKVLDTTQREEVERERAVGRILDTVGHAKQRDPRVTVDKESP